jgi:hypothetical protein
VPPHDKEIRCPRLGGPVPFRYCETSGSDGKPCFKVADCWWPYFDVVGYLKKRLTTAELRQVLAHRPRPKVAGILEQIARARRNVSSDPNEG